MSVITNCTTCGRELRAKDQYAGQRTRCPDCGTINLLPSKPDSPSCSQSAPVGAPEGVCRLCGQGFSADRDRVKDLKGRFYHRRCYETALRRQQEERESAPRSKTPVPQNKAVSQGSASPKQQSRNRVPETAPAPKPSSNASPASDDLWSELGSPLDSGEALWGDDLLAAGEPLSGGGGLGLAAGTVLQTRMSRSRWETSTKFLIGIGAAVPILLVVAILISIATRSDRSTQSVATAESPVESPEPREAESPPSVPPVHRPPSHRAAPARAPARGATREAESPPSVPPVHRPPSHRAAPARAPTRDTTSPEIPTGMIAAIGMILGVLAVVLTVVLSIAAATLKTACSVCHVSEPSFGKALLISSSLLIAPSPVLMCVPFLGGKGTVEQLALVLLVFVAGNTAVAGFIYGKCLRTTFGKGVLLCITQVLVLVFVGIVVTVVLFVAGLLFGGIAILTS